MRSDHVFEQFKGHKLEAGEQFPLPRNFDCLRALVSTYKENCGDFTDYDLKYVK